MRTDSTITVFNRKRLETGGEFMLPTIINGCTWHYAHIVSGTEYGDNNDEYSVRIPIDADTGGKEYIPPHDYAELGDELVDKYWTLQKNDLVVRGEMADTYEDQTQITSQTDDVFLVSTMADNTFRGNKATKHWRVGGA